MHHTLAPATTPDVNPIRTLVARWPLATFFVLAFGLTWAFLIADALGGRGLIPFRLTLNGPGLLLVLLMSYGPTIAALVVTAVTEGRAGLRSLLGAAARWRVGLRWYALALLGPAALFFVAGRLSELLGAAPQPIAEQGWTLLLMGTVGSVVRGLVNGEEIGWRGYALPRLLQRHNALTASLILGVIWAAFHLPIMVVPSSVAGGQSLDTALPFLISTLAMSTLATWVYRNTGGSVLLMILFHGALNAWPPLIGDGGFMGGVLCVLTAVAVVARYGPNLRPPLPRSNEA